MDELFPEMEELFPEMDELFPEMEELAVNQRQFILMGVWRRLFPMDENPESAR